jgi:hypothetical protein
MDLRVFGIRNVIELAPMPPAMHRMTGARRAVEPVIGPRFARTRWLRSSP